MCGTRDESLLLDDIILSATRLVELGHNGLSKYGDPDRETREMVLWNLTVIGEATKRLRPNTRQRFTDVGWELMAGTRDVIVHRYEGVDWEIVHGICTQHLPTMLPRLHEIHSILLAEAAQP